MLAQLLGAEIKVSPERCIFRQTRRMQQAQAAQEILAFGLMAAEGKLRNNKYIM